MARYSDEYRASAVTMLQAQGYPDRKGVLTEVATYLKIPPITLSRWYRAIQNPPPNKTVSIKKEQLIKLIKREIHAALREMDNARQDADYRALATAVGILTDKMQLLEGEPTQRIDTTPAIQFVWMDMDDNSGHDDLAATPHARPNGHSEPSR